MIDIVIAINCFGASFVDLWYFSYITYTYVSLDIMRFNAVKYHGEIHCIGRAFWKASEGFYSF